MHILNKKRQGFSLGMAMVILLMASLSIIASFSLFTIKHDNNTGTSEYVKHCIIDETAADLTTPACTGAINGCKAGIDKDCKTLFSLVGNNTVPVLKVSRAVCDAGGDKACIFLMGRCAFDSANCDLTGSENDIKYYLALPASNTNPGNLIVQTKGLEYFHHRMPNFNTEVQTVCDAEWTASHTRNSTACQILGYQAGTYTYDFDPVDRALFSEQDAVRGTAFSGGTVSLIPPATVANAEFMLQFGGANSDIGHGIVTDGSSIYIAGEESSDIHGGGKDIVVIRQDDYDGHIIWKNQYGGDDDDIAWGIISDGDYLYVVGEEASDSYGGGKDIMVMKLNKSDGSVVLIGTSAWKNQYGGSNDDVAYSVTQDTDNLYVTGSESSDDDGGSNDIVVLKISKATGVVAWKNQYGGAGDDAGKSITMSPDGSALYVTGYESSSVGGDGKDIFVMKLVPDTGVVQWKNHYGGAGVEIGHGIVISPDGASLYIAGEEFSDPSGGGSDIAVMNLDASTGNTVWKKQYGGVPDDKGNAIATDGISLYVTGEESSDPAGGRADIFIMQLDPATGNVQWKNQYGGATNERGNAIAVMGSYLYVTGEENSMTGGSSVSATGTGDIVSMKIDINQSTSNIGTSWTQNGTNLVLPNCGVITTWTLEGVTLNTELISTANNGWEDGWSLPGSPALTKGEHIREPNNGGSNNGRWKCSGKAPLNHNETISTGNNGWTLEGDTLNSEVITSAGGWTVGVIGTALAQKHEWVSTDEYNSMSGLSGITSVAIAQTTPGTTSVKWIISSDGRTTWKAWNGTAWAQVWNVNTNGNLNLYGFTTACTYLDIQNHLPAYTFPNGQNHLDFAFQLRSSSTTDAPSVDSISVSYF